MAPRFATGVYLTRVSSISMAVTWCVCGGGGARKGYGQAGRGRHAKVTGRRGEGGMQRLRAGGERRKGGEGRGD
eukprot:364857-Chlamydomonas_euryale.AAC.12